MSRTTIYAQGLRNITLSLPYKNAGVLCQSECACLNKFTHGSFLC